MNPKRDARAGARTGRSIHVVAPAKINLALEVLRRRDDGYHDVATLLQAVSLCDDLWIAERTEPGVGLRVLPRSLDVGPVAENLVTRAAERFLAEWPFVDVFESRPFPGVDIVLRKRIPAGAGMGGGSSDAAATLLGMACLFREQGTRGDGNRDASEDLDGSAVADTDLDTRAWSRLHEIAATLGSDVPFFLHGGTQIGSGRGEVLTPLPPWPGKFVSLVFPNVIVATSSIYAALKMPLTPPGPLATISHRGISGPLWKDDGSLPATFRNDLEPLVADRVPRVLEVLNLARAFGDRFVRVTGSGSGVFCLCPDEPTARHVSAQFRKHGFLGSHRGSGLLGCPSWARSPREFDVGAHPGLRPVCEPIHRRSHRRSTAGQSPVWVRSGRTIEPRWIPNGERSAGARSSRDRDV